MTNSSSASASVSVTLFQQISQLRSRGQLTSSQYDYYRKLCRNGIHRMKSNGPKKHLLQTERSWSYAMELRSKASTLNEPRKYRHAIKAWKRAFKNVLLLEITDDINSINISDVLQLNCYRSWILANLKMEEKLFSEAQVIFIHCQTIFPLLEDCLFKETCQNEIESFIRFCQYKLTLLSSSAAAAPVILPSMLNLPPNYEDLLRDSTLSSECSHLSLASGDELKPSSLLKSIPQLNSKLSFLNSKKLDRLSNILKFLKKNYPSSPLLKIIEIIIKDGNGIIPSILFEELQREYPTISFKKRVDIPFPMLEDPQLLFITPKPIFFDIASDFIIPSTAI